MLARVDAEGLKYGAADVRRGDGPSEAFNYTMPTLAATDRLIAENPAAAAGAVRAVVAAQKAVIADATRAAEVGRHLFPAEADLITDLVRRDLPYYEPQLSRAFVTGMNRFARAIGIIDVDAPYSSVVAEQLGGPGIEAR